MKKWTPLHHATWRILQKNILSSKQKKFLLCISGGADSVALFHIMKDLPIKTEVFHAHHGPGDNLSFRNQAQKFVEEICAKENIPFHLIQAEDEMKSENAFRQFRLSFLKKWSSQNSDGIIVMAHHAQDLLETRMIRLIRGTGPDGLPSMKIWKAPVFRPFLDSSPEVLKDFLNQQKLLWCEDPSNKNPRYFRNWLRHRWLPKLEKARPGGLQRLAHSLENISSLVPSDAPAQGNELFRTHYVALSSQEQLQRLALLLKSQGVSQYTSGQLKEVQKRLDNSQRRLSFKAAGALWTVNAQRILVEAL